MSDRLFPPKLRPGAHVRVVAPSTSMAGLPTPWRPIAEQRMADLRLELSFGMRVEEVDAFDAASVESRLADLHDAFADPGVDGILTFIGGYHANQLLDRIDFDLVAANPKVFCGYSDITALQHAFLARTGLVTYSGPHWSTFGMREHADDTIRWFRACLFDDAPVTLRSAGFYTDDAWFAQQDGRPTLPTDGWWTLRPGEAQGRLLPANLGTLSLLKGTPWWPALEGAILVVEDDELADVDDFARNLQSLLHQPGAGGVRGLAIGRFQQASGVTRDHLEALVSRLPQLDGLPVVANIDYGHTNPLATIPVGGSGRLVADEGDPHLVLTEH